MTTEVDIINNALQIIGTRTTVTEQEYTDQSSNEAIQAALVINRLRDDLLRMAPWDCALKTENLWYITSAPGTPENTSAATTLWQPGQPPPGWAYEYQYPVDCLKACWIIPAQNTGFAATGVPITTAVTGGSASWWRGPPIKFKIQTDTFYHINDVDLVTGGTGFLPQDILQFPQAAQGSAPYGAPGRIRVLTVGGPGNVLTFEIVNQVKGSSVPITGSYFAPQEDENVPPEALFRYGIPTDLPAAVGLYNLTFSATPSAQRVILTNQEYATLVYVREVTDPNLMDPLFQDAWAAILGSRLALSLTGNKDVANIAVMKANELVMEARKADGNEGLTVNDVTPDWIRTRGVAYADQYGGPYGGFDWGNLWSSYT